MDKALEAAERAARAQPEDLEKVRAYAAALRQSGWTFKNRELEGWLGELEAPKNSKARKLIAEKIGLAAVPGLIALLGHKGPKVRAAAANTLRRIGPPAAAAAPALIELLASETKPSVRKDAVEALGAIPGEAATRALLSLLQGPEPKLARLAAVGLRDRDRFADAIAAEIIASYQRVLGDDELWSFRADLLKTASALGRRADVLDFLTRALVEDPSTDAGRALAAIARLEDAEAVAALEGATRSDSHYLHDIAARALLDLGLAPGRLTACFLEAYEAAKQRVRIAACQNMARSIDRLDSAVLGPALLDALKRRPEDANWINGVLELIPASHEEAARVYAEQLRSIADEQERRRAIDTVRLSKNPARFALIKEVAERDPSPVVRSHAAHRLSWIEEADPAEVSALLRAYLKDPEQPVRLRAAIALEKANLGGSETLVALEEACRDPSEAVAKAARRALDKQRSSS